MLRGDCRASFDENHCRNEVWSVCIVLIIEAICWWVKIPNYHLHDNHTWNHTTATVPFRNTSVSMINFNFMNSQHSPSRNNMTNAIIKYTQYQNVTKNFTNIVQIIAHPFTLQSTRYVPPPTM